MKNWFERISGRRRVRGVTRPLYFAHIPKTAGTTLIPLLDRLVAAGDIYPHQLWRQVSDPAADFNRHNLYRGHFGGGGVRLLTDRRVDGLTMLRDPVALAVSTYAYVRREANTLYHEQLNRAGMDFSGFLDDARLHALIQDRMVRFLSFDFQRDPSAQAVFLSPHTLAHLKQHNWLSTKRISDAARHRRACRFVRRCRWFGIQERFRESMQLLCFEFGLPPMGAVQKLNVTPQRMELTAAERARVEALNPWDLRLYRWATALFDRRLQRMHKTLHPFRRDVADSTETLLDRRHRSVPRVRFAGLEFTMDQPLLGDGWHRRELAQPEGTHFRWSGPGEDSHLDFWLQPGEYRLQLRVINSVDETALQRLRLTVNGQALQWRSDAQAGPVHTLTARVPADCLPSSGLCRLAMHFEPVQTHAEAFASDDQRHLGFALHWVKLETWPTPTPQ